MVVTLPTGSFRFSFGTNTMNATHVDSSPSSLSSAPSRKKLTLASYHDHEHLFHVYYWKAFGVGQME